MNKIIPKDFCPRKKMNKIIFLQIKVMERIWEWRKTDRGNRKQKHDSRIYGKGENEQKFPLYHSIDAKLLITFWRDSRGYYPREYVKKKGWNETAHARLNVSDY